MLAWIADGKPLVAIGFASDADCELADSRARSQAEALARTLVGEHAIGVLVIGNRTAIPPRRSAHQAVVGDVLLVREPDASRWRVLAAGPCSQRESEPEKAIVPFAAKTPKVKNRPKKLAKAELPTK